jgi:hypothetical protein
LLSCWLIVVVELVELISTPFFEIKVYENCHCMSVTHAVHDIVAATLPFIPSLLGKRTMVIKRNPRSDRTGKGIQFSEKRHYLSLQLPFRLKKISVPPLVI